MNKLIHIRKTFVRQLNQNDCGVACLCMILNYAGLGANIPSLHQSTTIPDDGLSLLELRNLAGTFNLTSRCVEMELSFLREIQLPCILHMVNANGDNHFQVCYGARKKGGRYEYLMADPARQVYYLNETQLIQEWSSKAALYFEDLVPAIDRRFKSFLYPILSVVSFPKGLWITIPLLNICAVIFGIAITWVLQRGINYSLADKKDSMVIAVTFLLFVITLFKALFSYVRQRILIALNFSLNAQLVFRFVNGIIYKSKPKNGLNSRGYVKRKMGEIQKIQNAVLISMATVASDGSLVLLLLSLVFYLLPPAGYINMGYLIIVCAFNTKNIAAVSFDYANLNELSGRSEDLLNKEMVLDGYASDEQASEQRRILHYNTHDRYLKFARSIAVKINNRNLLYECIGAVNIISVFTLGIIQLQRQQMEYNSFMIIVILSYFITTLLPKICNSLFIIAEGCEAHLQFTIGHS